MSLRSLRMILERETLGQTSRYQRYTAELLFMIAAGKRIDPDRTPTFKTIVGEIYQNPFMRKKPELKTSDEILGYLVRQMEEMIDGSAASCGQN